jgi:DNA-binding transcriptional MocR family regulator
MTLMADASLPELPLPGRPLYERLAEHYRRAIGAGALAGGDRMPSVRAVMQRHQISLSTALQALRTLEDDGWLTARPRSGYFVRDPAPDALKLARSDEPDTATLPAAAQYVGLNEAIANVIARGQAAEGALNLGGATPDATLFPTARLQALATRVLRRHPQLLTDAGDDVGSLAYRQAIARRALGCGMTLAPQDLIVTSGGVDGLNLALRAVTQPGDAVAIETPGFSGLLQTLASLGLRTLEIPSSARTGLSIEALTIALEAYPDIKAVVVVPHLQNPLGSVMPDERKEALVALCARHGVALIEDEPYRELLDDPQSVRPLKAWDRDGGVIHCASLNKVLAPGLRLGWMAAGRWQARVRMFRYAQSRHGLSLPQLVAAEFIGSGDFDRHLNQLRPRLAAQRAAMARAVARWFPAGTRLSLPAGGLVLWVEMPQGVSSDVVFTRALEAGIRVSPGSIYSNSARFASFLRISCPRPFDAALDDAMRTLGDIVATANGGSGASRPAVVFAG